MKQHRNCHKNIEERRELLFKYEYVNLQIKIINSCFIFALVSARFRGELNVLNSTLTKPEDIAITSNNNNYEFHFLDTSSRSSRLKVFLVKGVLKLCSKFTGEHP